MIKVLPKEVADKIAAGEVIESPVSIVKELIENSIDSGATNILCEITKGGKDEIRVTDNGCGIPADQVDTAFLRHATSKIEKAEDLNNLLTLGFRGEALASICAVSRTELITKTESETFGTRIVIHGGITVSKESIGCPNGTTIIVKDLFYNVPARLKFLKSEASEAGKIIDMMSKLAITRPDIRFSLISNGKNYFTTLGNGDLKSAILSVYKEREYKDLIEVRYPYDNGEIYSPIRIKGYISRPSFTRNSRRSQYVFVNGRTVKNNSIDKGIDLGYKERVFEGKHPIVFLFADVDSAKVDVNVHPNKKEVRFNDEIAIITAVEEAIKKSIGSQESVIKATDTISLKPNTHLFENQDKAEQINMKEFLAKKERNFIIKDDEDQLHEEFKDNEVKTQEAYSSFAEGKEALKERERAYSTELGEPDIKEVSLKPFDFDELNYGETIFGTYITATDSDNFYLFDQHAAHERINYEKLINFYLSDEGAGQLILTPFTFDVPGEMLADESEWIEILSKMGYGVELFGTNTYIVREIPLFMSLTEAEEFAKVFIDTYYEDRITDNKVVIDKIISKACKSSIKAHDYIKPEEVNALIEDLKRCRNPFSCPHGRPTFIKFSKYDIEKLFKRVI